MGRVAGQMRRLSRVAAVILTGIALARPASAGEAGEGAPVPVPSGEEVHWIETIRDSQGPAGLTLRFRFLAPGIGGGPPISQEAAQADMQALCDGFALSRVPETGPKPAQIIISLSDRLVPFGETDDDAVQYFEAYSIEDGACVWELF